MYFHFFSNLRRSRFAAIASSESHLVIGYDGRRAHRLSGATLSSSYVMTLTIYSVNALAVVAGDGRSTECLRGISNDTWTIFLVFRNVEVMTIVFGRLKVRFECANWWSEMQSASSISTPDSDSGVSVPKMSRRLSSRVRDVTTLSCTVSQAKATMPDCRQHTCHQHPDN